MKLKKTMRYIDEFREPALLSKIISRINSAARENREYRLMEFCGGHTHSLFRFGLISVLPENIKMIHGPGCPVCVLPIGRLDMALSLVREEEVILCSYGDMLRVPGSLKGNLLQLRSEGADIRMVSSSLEAVAVAAAHPGRPVVFFAIGFETTTPQTAAAVLEAERAGLDNFSVFCNHVLTPSAVMSILESDALRREETVRLDGFIGPGHVSAVIGTQPFEFFAEEFEKPVVIAGFEPADLLSPILKLLGQVNEGRSAVENAYGRAVTREGNHTAKRLVSEVFEPRRVFEWRSLGKVPYSALRLKKNTRASTPRRGMPCGRSPRRNIPAASAGPFYAA